jgi:hypothetical protein
MTPRPSANCEQLQTSNNNTQQQTATKRHHQQQHQKTKQQSNKRQAIYPTSIASIIILDGADAYDTG